MHPVHASFVLDVKVLSFKDILSLLSGIQFLAYRMALNNSTTLSTFSLVSCVIYACLNVIGPTSEITTVVISWIMGELNLYASCTVRRFHNTKRPFLHFSLTTFLLVFHIVLFCATLICKVNHYWIATKDSQNYHRNTQTSSYWCKHKISDNENQLNHSNTLANR